MVIKLNYLSNILFLDIETVSEYPAFEELPDHFKPLWKKKCRQFEQEEDEISDEIAAKWYEEKAGIFAEFAKVVCISVGYLTMKGDQISGCRLKSFYSEDEREVLEAFSDLLSKHFNNTNRDYICGHNIKEFDIPFICRRLLIHNMGLPTLLDISGKKPWEVHYLMDTMLMWKFGEYKNYTSLNLLSAVLGIPSPKDDIDGSMVGKVFWEEKDIRRIAVYCEKDVVTVIQVVMKFAGRELIEDEIIEILTE